MSDNAALIGALVGLGGVFTTQLVNSALDDRRAQESREAEDRRTQESLELEAQRAHEAALQNYFEQVGALLIGKPLLRASPGDNLSTVVRAQTLSVLEGLDPNRKRILLQFLYEAELINKDKPVVSLVLANLSEANLRGVNLVQADLSGAILSEAILSSSTILSEGDPSEALSRSWEYAANLGGTKLIQANLLKANLSEAILSEANLSEAFLIEADLSGANLSGANLSEADLSGVDLHGANLLGVHGITAKRLEHQAIVLEGATMPNGQKYEDWLKSREGDGE